MITQVVPGSVRRRDVRGRTTMGANLRPRFWWEAILGAVTGVLGLVTIFWSDWIEAIFGVDPDHGNGSAEWLIVAVLLVASLALAFGARFEWRRARPSMA
jgi:hypothetical protein